MALIGTANLAYLSGSSTNSVLPISGSLTLTKGVDDDPAELRLCEDESNGHHYTGFKSADSLSGNVMYTLPSADATSSGYQLTSNGSGVLSWAAAGSGGGGLEASDFRHDQWFSSPCCLCCNLPEALRLVEAFNKHQDDLCVVLFEEMLQHVECVKTGLVASGDDKTEHQSLGSPTIEERKTHATAL